MTFENITVLEITVGKRDVTKSHGEEKNDFHLECLHRTPPQLSQHKPSNPGEDGVGQSQESKHMSTAELPASSEGNCVVPSVSSQHSLLWIHFTSAERDAGQSWAEVLLTPLQTQDCSYEPIAPKTGLWAPARLLLTKDCSFSSSTQCALA